MAGEASTSLPGAMVRVREIARGASKSARLEAPPGPALDGSERSGSATVRLDLEEPAYKNPRLALWSGSKNGLGWLGLTLAHASENIQASLGLLGLAQEPAEGSAGRTPGWRAVH